MAPIAAAVPINPITVAASIMNMGCGSQSRHVLAASGCGTKTRGFFCSLSTGFMTAALLIVTLQAKSGSHCNESGDCDGGHTRVVYLFRCSSVVFTSFHGFSTGALVPG